ncbi:hypothetical protein PUG81_15375 [Erwiniaceae bacterium L1_54_6]|nr:hypothetical protein [Erwiniaceae bacterium L1_54_6]
MRKPVKIALAVVAISVASIATVFAYYWPIIKMEFEGSAHYTQQDKKLYEHFTPEILKKIPRISSSYEFAFYNNDGPGTLGYTVTFHNTTDTGQISAYLTSLGYIKQDNCSVVGACWKGNDPREKVSFAAIPKLNEVLVTVEY